MKILNLYAGIGGNRKLWPDGHKIIAIEINPKIAEIYQLFRQKLICLFWKRGETPLLNFFIGNRGKNNV
jgi:site-specific DNA-cytosine methylase